MACVTIYLYLEVSAMSIGSSEKGGPYEASQREETHLPGVDYRKRKAAICARLRLQGLGNLGLIQSTRGS